jgi:hypothetical protein
MQGGCVHLRGPIRPIHPMRAELLSVDRAGEKQGCCGHFPSASCDLHLWPHDRPLRGLVRPKHRGPKHRVGSTRDGPGRSSECRRTLGCPASHPVSAWLVRSTSVARPGRWLASPDPKGRAGSVQFNRDAGSSCVSYVDFLVTRTGDDRQRHRGLSAGNGITRMVLARSSADLAAASIQFASIVGPMLPTPMAPPMRMPPMWWALPAAMSPARRPVSTDLHDAGCDHRWDHDR